MLFWIVFILTIIISYLLGSVNTSIVITKIMGTDIRNFGSGNAGATNMLRTYGKGAAIGALAGDLLKGVIAVGLATYIQHLMEGGILGEPLYYASNTLKYLCGIAVILGHNYPLFFGFKGGKGIGTSGAVIVMLDWRVGLSVVALTIAIIAISRYVSLGSIISGILYPLISAIFIFFIDKSANHYAMIFSVIIGALAIYRHKSNIGRLIHGTESKLGQKKLDT